jgi:hypothetical protein
MESHRFDTLVRSLTRSRRAVVGGALGLGALTWPGWLDAKKKRKRKKRKKRKHQRKNIENKDVTFNEFGCVDVGGYCENAGQCCSGICEGQACQAHDASTCQAGQRQAFCGGEGDLCVAAAGEEGLCNTTTGNAPYCAHDIACFACAKDADCIPFCGSRAACLVCPAPDCIARGITTVCASTAGRCTFPSCASDGTQTACVGPAENGG